MNLKIHFFIFLLSSFYLFSACTLENEYAEPKETTKIEPDTSESKTKVERRNMIINQWTLVEYLEKPVYPDSTDKTAMVADVTEEQQHILEINSDGTYFYIADDQVHDTGVWKLSDDGFKLKEISEQHTGNTIYQIDSLTMNYLQLSITDSVLNRLLEISYEPYEEK